MQRGQAPHKAVTSARANTDAATMWRLRCEWVEEKHADLEKEHARLQAEYAQLHSGYKSALARLYVALDRQHCGY